MLINDLYTVVNMQETEKGFIFSIIINEKNNIFKGHFPDNPVVPGVILINVIKELLELKYNNELLLSKADNIKFKALVIPNFENVLFFEINILEKVDDSLKITCNIFNSEITFVNFKGLFSIKSN